MKDQLKAIAMMAGAGLVAWALFTAFVTTYNINKLLNGQCAVVEQTVIDAAVEKALEEAKVVDNP